jgi:hypothetical protein
MSVFKTRLHRIRNHIDEIIAFVEANPSRERDFHAVDSTLQQVEVDLQSIYLRKEARDNTPISDARYGVLTRPIAISEEE